MKKYMNKISTGLKVLILSAIVILGTQIAVAWNPAPPSPPNSNVPAPINAGTSAQAKNSSILGGPLCSAANTSCLNVGGTLSSDVLSVFGVGYVGGNLGVGVANPAAKLDVAGTIKISGGTPGAGKVLTSDATGLASWVTPTGGGGEANTSSNVGVGTGTLVKPKVGVDLPFKTIKAGANITINNLTNEVEIVGTGGGVGPGTINRIPKFLTTTTIGNSLITDNGTNVGINDTTPTHRLDIPSTATAGIGLSDKLAISADTTWLRLNQSSAFSAGVYVQNQGVLRTDAPLQIGTQATNNLTGPIAGQINVSENLKIGAALTTGTVAADLIFPGGNRITTNYNNANPTDAAYNNMFVMVRQGFFVCKSAAGNGSCDSTSFVVDNSGNAQANGFFYLSDQSLKKNIAPLQGSLSKILQLKGVSFDWKESGRSNIGLIAQDVEKVYPELVQTDKNTGLKSVEYGNLVAPLIEAVKEQQKQIEDLKAQVNSLQSKIK